MVADATHLKVEAVELPVGDHGWESLALDRRRLDLDTVQNGRVAARDRDQLGVE